MYVSYYVLKNELLLFVTLIIYQLLPKVHHHIISFCYVTYVFKWVTFKEAWSRFRVTKSNIIKGSWSIIPGSWITEHAQPPLTESCQNIWGLCYRVTEGYTRQHIRNTVKSKAVCWQLPLFCNEFCLFNTVTRYFYDIWLL